MAEQFPPFGGPPIGMETVPGKKNEDQTQSIRASQDSNALLGRVRDVERRFSDIQGLLKFQEDQALKNFNKAWERIKTVEDKITQVSHQLAEFEEQLHLIISELRLTAKKEDYDVMKRYIDYIKPTRFVTVEQVEKIVQDIVESHHEKKEGIEEE